MVAKARRKVSRVRELSIEEGRELLEHDAQQYLRMSAVDFIRAWYAREFGVRPRRQNWARVLRRTREVFEAERTWPRSGGV